MDAPSEPPPPADTKFVTMVGVLLLTIIVLLAGLWLRTRRRARRAEQLVSDFVRQRDRLGPAIEQAMAEHAKRLSVRREQLLTRPVNLNGREVAALHLPAEQAQRIGFQPGDVIVVDQPTTAPATTRAGPPGAE